MSGLVGLVDSPMSGLVGHLVGLLDSWWDLWTPYVNLVGFLSKYTRLLVWQLWSWFGSYAVGLAVMAFLDI